ncbi:MAG: hypothetical protein PHC97_03360 [Patescibacteria group bacterium]|nr:hypothetical protein [Patescibacteria group bacterium]
MALFRKFEKKNIYKFGIGGGILEIIYILLIALLMNYLNEITIMINQVVGALSMLLLFVFSAAVSGFLVLGYPAYLALTKKIKEAILTVLTTILTLFVAGVIIFLLAIFNVI